MQLDEDQVSYAVDELRKIGAVSIVQGDGRVEKYRHLLYDWLGVDKVELAVMAELLLRGEQTLGELRGRAARMEPIKGISELQPIVDSLRQKDLLLLLTPPGRGCVVTHALYQEQELAKLRATFDGSFSAAVEPAPDPVRPAAVGGNAEVAALREEVALLRRQITELQEQVADIDQMRDALAELSR